MKIFSATQIKEADNYTIQNEPVASIDLMERAAKACVNWIVDNFDSSHTFGIFCGLGNNGADGLAIARLLIEQKLNVQVFVINHSANRSRDFTENYERLKTKIAITELNNTEEITSAFHSFENNYIVVDALLGTGIRGNAEGLIKETINFINHSYLKIISIDIPSGMFSDILNEEIDCIVKANYTLSFQFPKFTCLLPETSAYVGKFSVLDIGISQKYINNTATNNYLITKQDVQKLLKHRNINAHKGTFGHALLIVGSYGKMGAAVLSSRACMRSGVGLLTVRIPKCGYEIMQTTIPEAMIDCDSTNDYISDNIKIEKYNSIGIGPGIGMDSQTQNIFKLLIQNSSIPLLFDADAINILSENKTWLSFIPPYSIFTPHLMEFERLVGKADNSAERIKQQIEFSLKYNAYVVLKGAHTSISSPNGNIYFNSSGNPGMATAGSGDVLTGIITGLLAQGYSSENACIVAIYIHGLAGDSAAYKLSMEAMIASDIIENIADAFKFMNE